MATLKKGVRMPRGSYLEIEIDGVMWRITKETSGAVIFEVDTGIGMQEIDDPPEQVELLWALIDSEAIGSGPH